MANNPNNIRLSACRVRYGGADLGFTTGGVDVSIKTTTKAINVDQYGATPINEIVLGRTLTIKIPFAETDLDTFYSIMKSSGAQLQNPNKNATATIVFKSLPAAGDTITIGETVVDIVASEEDEAAPGTFPAVVDHNAAVFLNNICTTINAHASDIVATNNGVLTITLTGKGATTKGTVISANIAGGAGIITQFTGGTNSADRSVLISSNAGKSLFSQAQELVLHPLNLDDADATEDFIVPLAATAGDVEFSYKYDAIRVFTISFTGYVDPNTDILCRFGSNT